ncbi:sigma-70 family RNA polymerase sigma factor [Polyangium sp. 15x6]|uniref:RNA polymerase sigma factor n=1 Tax=Polyangium sp. 15x6 TaxID=3042687 RepID=UPI00249C4F48|nr:sigma-70 family RNA polymerase sigma factor [Polyangium sp. 15x6]MDI3291865.1 sigma-70 family RNA polymerase sigma factor [Polyangium sp. 15x6]
MASADGARWRRLHGEHAGAVLRTLVECGVALRDIEDVLQDVFFVAFRRRNVLPVATREVRHWLLALARRCAANWRKLERHTYEVLDAQAIEAARAMPEEPEAHAELVDALRVALGRLDEADGQLLVWRFVEGETLREIGRRIGLRKSGAEVRVARARKRLRRLLFRPRMKDH